MSQSTVTEICYACGGVVSFALADHAVRPTHGHNTLAWPSTRKMRAVRRGSAEVRDEGLDGGAQQRRERRRGLRKAPGGRPTPCARVPHDTSR